MPPLVESPATAAINRWIAVYVVSLDGARRSDAGAGLCLHTTGGAIPAGSRVFLISKGQTCPQCRWTRRAEAAQNCSSFQRLMPSPADRHAGSRKALMTSAASSAMRAGAFSSWCEWSWRRPTARRHSHGGEKESDHGTAPAALICPDHPVEHGRGDSVPAFGAVSISA